VEEFLDAVHQLERQTLEQRRDDIAAKERAEGLTPEEQRERWALILEIKAMGARAG
jgi:hypothetical protein